MKFSKNGDIFAVIGNTCLLNLSAATFISGVHLNYLKVFIVKGDKITGEINKSGAIEILRHL
jgi:hypothetical protein